MKTHQHRVLRNSIGTASSIVILDKTVVLDGEGEDHELSFRFLRVNVFNGIALSVIFYFFSYLYLDFNIVVISDDDSTVHTESNIAHHTIKCHG